MLENLVSFAHEIPLEGTIIAWSVSQTKSTLINIDGSYCMPIIAESSDVGLLSGILHL